jgi:uncharacterized YccA/Bax inhibitor family protein
MRTANPALNQKTFDSVQARTGAAMTLNGTVNKTGFLLLLAVVSATYTWEQFNQDPARAMPWMLGGLIGGLVVCLITIFKKEWSPVTAPLYALLEGLLLGAVSAAYNQQFKGIVLQAVLLTFGTLAALLMAYVSRLIRPTENFKLGVVAATGAIALLYLASLILGFFSIRIPFIHEAGWFGIAFSAFVVVVAALNLVLDFDFIEQGCAQGAPKFMEWYAAFGLIVTLVWLYLEILRLLAKLSSRR